ncbi:MAG: ethanolamine ammonia-lyase subunit EutC [Bdellovibrionales bacterium]
MSKTKPPVTASPWRDLRKLTNARIALGHSGESLPTEALLAFQLDHARARDAVKSALDFPALIGEIEKLKLRPVQLQSHAKARDEYLRNPGKGRRLSIDSVQKWSTLARMKNETVLVALGDGLSARAIQLNGCKLLAAIAAELGNVMIKDIPLINHARVAIGDELSSIANAEVVMMLIGERPGLSASENISIYITYRASIGTTDEARNCISNIGGPGGLSIADAAAKAVYMARRAIHEQRSGIHLKDDQKAAPTKIGGGV